MRGRLEVILAGTAVALVLTTTGYSLAQSPAMTPEQIEAAVPIPEPANTPPPTATDLDAKPTTTATIPAETATPPAAQTAQPAPPPASTPAATEAPKEASKETSKPAPAATAEADPVTERLRDVVTTKLSRFFDRKGEREGVTAFYTARNFAPLFLDNGVANARASATVAYLKSVATEGLDPADYPTPDFAKATSPESQAEAEMRLVDSVLTFVRHAQTGRVHYSRVSADILYNLVSPDADDVLAVLAKTDKTGDALAAYNPRHAGYKALKAKLAEARDRKGNAGPARIESGPVLKIANIRATKNKPAEELTMQDPRVPQLRARLGVVAADANDTTYDKPLADAVRKFQSQHGLAANGHLTGATVDALNGPRRDRDADIIIANMERWRWLPHDLGRQHVILNVPDFTLKVMDNGKTAWTTRVVTGKPGKMATPMLSETIKFITVNPTWNVPPSIINNEYLPALQQDPGALARIGLKVTENNDGSIRIYQPPGDGNALGRLRFNFPNKFLVYQHDTPDKHLFANERRAYSHGCMRVQNPDKYAEVLLSLSQPNEGWTVDRLRRMYGNSEQNINLVRPIPVHITYQTAFVDDGGHLQIREDVYGRDAALLAILKGDTRGADIAVANRSEGTTTVRKDFQLPDSVFTGGRANGDRYASSESNFFERLFGGGSRVAPPAPVPQGRRMYYR